MKINKATLKAVSAKAHASANSAVKADTSAKKGASGKTGAKASGKAKKAVKAEISALLKGFKVGQSVVLLLDGGEKGTVAREAIVKSASHVQLVRDCKGLKYDGSLVGLAQDGKDWDKETRLQVGNYCASKGNRAKVSVLSMSDAIKLFSEKHTIERNGHKIQVFTAKGRKLDKQYTATRETLKNGANWFFQWESARAQAGYEKHYGELVK